MEVTAFQNTIFSPVGATRNTARDFSFEEARAKIRSPGEPRPNPRDLLLDSFDFVNRRVPPILTTGPLAAFRVVDAVRFFSRRVQSNQIPLVRDFDQKERFTDLKLDRLSGLRTTLEDLSGTVSTLLGVDALNIRRAESSRPNLVDAQAGKNSPLTTFSAKPLQLSSNRVLTSDALATPLGALGLSGSFTINGFKVTLKASDSIFDIRDQINFGEDANKNGVLDGPEDVNGNGALDSLSVPASEFGAGIFLVEDLNGNGVLEPSEDRNNNDRLDGGSQNIGVNARVRDNRLVLTALAGGSDTIDLTDTDGILLKLGFFELNSKGLPILKEFQFDSSVPPVNLIQSPRPAEIELDGTSFKSGTNTFPGLVEDTTLTAKKVTGNAAQIRIRIDAEHTVQQIRSLFDQFNTAIKTINGVLEASRAFARDREIQNIRNDLTLRPQEKINANNLAKQALDPILGAVENPKKTGIQTINTEKKTLREVSVTSILKSIQNGMTGFFKNNEINLLKRLTSIGIRTLEDDTFQVSSAELNEALNTHPEDVLALFTDPETGVLPLLEGQLSRILKEDLGDLDLKQNQVVTRSEIPSALAEKFRRFTENATLNKTVQNLIAVI